MDRSNFFFKQKVKATELRSAFTNVENALKDFLRGFNYVGIVAGAEVTQSVSPNLTVNVTGPATIYDQDFNHIEWFTTQNVNCAVDETGNATEVTTVSQSRWLTLFAEFRTEQADPRIDGNGNTVYYSETESYRINVVQGGQSLTPSRPSLRGDQILIADILLQYGQTTILNADIETDRTEVVYDLQDSPSSIKARSLQDALGQMLTVINAFTAATISSGAVAGSPFSLPSGTLATHISQLLANENTLDSAVDAAVATHAADLATLNASITTVNTVPAISDSPLSLAGGTIIQSFTQLLAALNDSAALLARANTFTTGPQTMNNGGLVANGADSNDTYAVDAVGGGTNNGSRNSTGLRARGRGLKPGIETIGGSNGAGSGGAGITSIGRPGGYFEGAGDGTAVQALATGAAHAVRGDASNDPISCGVAGFANDGHAGVQGNAGNGECGVEGIGVSTKPGVLGITVGTGSGSVALRGECSEGKGVHGKTTSGTGVWGEATSGIAVYGEATQNVGVEGKGGTTFAGGKFTGGTTGSGPGLEAYGGGVNGSGAVIEGQGDGFGIDVLAKGAAPGIQVNQTGGGIGISILTTSKAALRLAPQGIPASLSVGDMWFDGDDLYVRVNGAQTYKFSKTLVP